MHSTLWLRLGGRYIDRLQPLRTLKKVVMDRLTLFQRPKALHLNGCVMDEHIGPAVTRYETIAFLVAEPLHHPLALLLYFLLVHFYFLRMGWTDTNANEPLFRASTLNNHP